MYVFSSMQQLSLKSAIDELHIEGCTTALKDKRGLQEKADLYSDVQPRYIQQNLFPGKLEKEDTWTSSRVRHLIFYIQDEKSMLYEEWKVSDELMIRL